MSFAMLALELSGCANTSPYALTADNADAARGPWAELPTFTMPTGDTSIPIELLRDVGEALLRRGGAKVCDSNTRTPIVGLSTEYCSTIYVAGDRDNLSWRVTEPVQGEHGKCIPFLVVRDADYSSTQTWIVGYVHNHPCAGGPSSKDMGAWPTDKFDPYVSMAEFRLIPGNPEPAIYKGTAIEMASALVAERQDGTRIYLRYFPTGEVQQWSERANHWATLGFCAPRGEESNGFTPRCDHEPLELLRE